MIIFADKKTMHQIIVILLVLKKWFKNVKVNILTFIMTVCALIITFYCYLIYNNVQEQFININHDIMGNGCAESTDVIVQLDYASLETKYSNFGHRESSCIRTNTTININDSLNNIINSDSIYSWFTRKEALEGSKYQLPLYSELNKKFNASNFSVSTSIGLSYEDNSWGLIRINFIPALLNEQFIIKDIAKDSCELLYYSKSHIRTPLNDYDLYIGRSNSYINYNYIKASSINQKTNDSFIISNEFAIGKELYEPHFYSAYDISKINFHFHINDLNDTKTTLEINFLDLIEIGGIYPEPDVISTNGFKYVNSNKLSYIYNNGIDCYIKFPKTENLQNSRNYIISALITLFFSLLCAEIWKILKIKYKERRRNDNLCSKLLEHKHKDLFIKFKNLRLASNIAICFCLAIIFFIMLPNKNFFKFIFAIILFISIPLISHSRNYFYLAKERLVSKDEYTHFTNKINRLSIIGSICFDILLFFFFYHNSNDIVFSLCLTGFVIVGTAIGIYIAYLIQKKWINNFYQNLEKGTLKRFFNKEIMIISIFLAVLLIIYLFLYNMSVGIIVLFLTFLVMLIYYGIKIRK